MRFPVRRRWIAVVALFAGPVVTVTAAPDWARETAKDFFAYPAAEKEIRELARQCEDYQEELNVIRRRCDIKEAILDELETDQISLLDAAARFRALDLNSRKLSAIFYPPERVGSFDEIAALTVISHMKSRLHGTQPMYADTLTRLECDFETAYGYRPE